MGHARLATLALLSLCGICGTSTVHAAGIGLTASVDNPRVIRGGTTDVHLAVSNTDSTGDPLSYTAYVTFPYTTVTAGSGNLAPSGRSVADEYTKTFDSTGQNYGPNPIVVTVQSANATNSPQEVTRNVDVLAPGIPFVWFGQGPLQRLDVLAVQEPSVDPLAFGATGGGDTAALASWIVNDPPYPTAALDLDGISSVGDPQITMSLTTFSNLPADDEPIHGQPFTIFVDLSTPGTFSKRFFLNFSDEDLPGARGAGSIQTSFLVTTTVPEPAATAVVVCAASILCGRRRMW